MTHLCCKTTGIARGLTLEQCVRAGCTCFLGCRAPPRIVYPRLQSFEQDTESRLAGTTVRGPSIRKMKSHPYFVGIWPKESPCLSIVVERYVTAQQTLTSTTETANLDYHNFLCTSKIRYYVALHQNMASFRQHKYYALTDVLRHIKQL